MNGNKRRNYLACRWIPPGPLGKWYNFLTLCFYSLWGRLLNGHRLGTMWASVDGRNVFRKNYRLSMAEFLKLVWVLAILPQSNQSEKSLQVNWMKMEYISNSEKLEKLQPGCTLLIAGCLLTGALGLCFGLVYLDLYLGEWNLWSYEEQAWEESGVWVNCFTSADEEAKICVILRETLFHKGVKIAVEMPHLVKDPARSG